MLEAIEKLLILQDRDRKISRVTAELEGIGPQRQALQSRLTGSQTVLDAAKQRSKQIESDRKKLELDAEAKKGQIDKYASQQLQTKKNDEYRALANEIDHCKAAIFELENQQLNLMEHAEASQKEAGKAALDLNEAKKEVDRMSAELSQREEALKKQLADLESNYDQLTGGIEDGVLDRYQRLRRKTEHVVVGVDRGVCGGCHMKLPVQIIRSCQAHQEIVNCPNCARILYYTPHMDLVAAD